MTIDVKNGDPSAATPYLVAFLAMLLMWAGRHHPWTHWAMAVLALLTVFGPGFYILKMAWASARRRILNQHVLMEVAAFGGLVGGAIGLLNPVFPSPDFFGVNNPGVAADGG